MTVPILRLPRLSVSLDGAPLDDRLAPHLTSLVVRQALGAPAALELGFSDAPDILLAPLRPGLSASVNLTSGAPLFTGQVTEIAQTLMAGAAGTFRVTARDALHQLGRRQSLLALQDVTVEDLARRFAGEIGLSCRCLDPGPRRQAVLQQEETDFDFLTDLAEQAGLYPVQRDAELLVLSLAGDDLDPVVLTRGANLLALQTRLSGDRFLPGGRLMGRDAVTLVPREARLSLARQDQIELRDPGGDLGTGERVLLNRQTGGDDEARAILQASLDRSACDVAVAEGLAEGDALLMPGRVIRLDGVADAFMGAFVVTRCQHRFTAEEGYVTEFSTQRPQRPPVARGPMVTIAEVSDVDDPEAMGRCAVKLTDFGGLDAGWMHVVVAGAGARKGMVALPDLGDEVLVLMPEGDPARGVILGGLYGTDRMPKGATDLPRGIVLRSKDGQVLELKGAQGAARLANRTGSSLEISPGRTRLAAASDMLIEAPGKTIIIRANAIKFERG